jgi:hypothetical protein
MVRPVSCHAMHATMTIERKMEGVERRQKSELKGWDKRTHS